MVQVRPRLTSMTLLLMYLCIKLLPWFRLWTCVYTFSRHSTIEPPQSFTLGDEIRIASASSDPTQSQVDIKIWSEKVSHTVRLSWLVIKYSIGRSRGPRNEYSEITGGNNFLSYWDHSCWWFLPAQKVSRSVWYNLLAVTMKL